jgi:hypothetical protein
MDRGVWSPIEHLHYPPKARVRFVQDGTAMFGIHRRSKKDENEFLRIHPIILAFLPGGEVYCITLKCFAVCCHNYWTRPNSERWHQRPMIFGYRLLAGFCMYLRFVPDSCKPNETYALQVHGGGGGYGDGDGKLLCLVPICLD